VEEPGLIWLRVITSAAAICSQHSTWRSNVRVCFAQNQALCPAQQRVLRAIFVAQHFLALLPGWRWESPPIICLNLGIIICPGNRLLIDQGDVFSRGDKKRWLCCEPWNARNPPGSSRSGPANMPLGPRDRAVLTAPYRAFLVFISPPVHAISVIFFSPYILRKRIDENGNLLIAGRDSLAGPGRGQNLTPVSNGTGTLLRGFHLHKPDRQSDRGLRWRNRFASACGSA